MCSAATCVCRLILPLWHCKQVRTTEATAVAIRGQQKLAATNFLELLTPGCAILCKDHIAAVRNAAGRRGRKIPVEMSPSKLTAPTGWVTILSEGDFCMAATSGHVRCASATAAKSRGGKDAVASGGFVGGDGDGKGAAAGGLSTGPAGGGGDVAAATTSGGRESASATTLAFPGVWRMSVVNSEI